MWRLACDRSRPRGARGSLDRLRVYELGTAAEIEVNRGGWGIAWFFPHDPADARHDSPAVGLREEIDFNFDAFTDFVFVSQLKQNSADAEIHDLTWMPF